MMIFEFQFVRGGANPPLGPRGGPCCSFQWLAGLALIGIRATHSNHHRTATYVKMVKSNRNGQAATLSPEQLDAIAEQLPAAPRGVFSICRFTAARVSEALNLRWENILPSEVVIPKTITKKKMKTRAIPMNPRLWEELTNWKQRWRETQNRDPDKGDYVFPNGRDPAKHMTRQAVDKALRGVCSELDVLGVSTHSLRRSALTAASDKGVPLRVLQSISGHSSLEMLQRYLDVKDEAKRAAAMAFG